MDSKLKAARETQVKEFLVKERATNKDLKEKFEHLFEAKTNKTINEVLSKRFTQLSYLPKDEQELNKLYASNGIYKYLIHFLNQL